MNIRKKSISVIVSIGVIFLMMILYAFKSKTTNEESYQPQPKWKNLKVLPKNISKDSLDYLMEGYTSALSVKCNYCHASQKDNPSKLDFASDDKMLAKIKKDIINIVIPRVKAKYPKYNHLFNNKINIYEFSGKFTVYERPRMGFFRG